MRKRSRSTSGRCISGSRRSDQSIHEVAYPLNGLAVLYNEQGKYAEAEPLYQRALHIWEAGAGTRASAGGLPAQWAGQSLLRAGKYAEAEPLYQRALHIREQALGPQHSLTRTAVKNYAILLRKMKRETEALSLEARFPPSPS